MVREPAEEHEVHKHAGDGDVIPERKSPLGPGAVADKVASESEGKGRQNERDNRDGENRMRGQKREVKPAPKTLAVEIGQALFKFAEQVTRQKNHRHTKCGEHHGPVRGNLLLLNENKSRREADSGRAV